jgi:hypothetical protein
VEVACRQFHKVGGRRNFWSIKPDNTRPKFVWVYCTGVFEDPAGEVILENIVRSFLVGKEIRKWVVILHNGHWSESEYVGVGGEIQVPPLLHREGKYDEGRYEVVDTVQDIRSTSARQIIFGQHNCQARQELK